MSQGREKHKQIFRGIKPRCSRLLKHAFHPRAGGTGLRVPPVDGTRRAGGEQGAKRALGEPGVLPTSGGAGSAGGSGYSSRAQPESLSDEAGGRPVAVLQGGGSSRWGHAGLGRDMSWGERIRAGETLGEAGSRRPSPGHVSSHRAQRGPASTWQQDKQPLVLGRDPGAGPTGMMLSTTVTSRPLAEPLQKSEGFWGLLLSLQTHTEGMGAWQGWGFICRAGGTDGMAMG